jgi:hypothetical protein
MIGFCTYLIANGIKSLAEIKDRFEYLQHTIEQAFDRAVNEPKIHSRSELIEQNSASLASLKGMNV